MSYDLKIDQGVEIAPVLAQQVTLIAEQLRYSLRVKSKDRAAFNEASGLSLPNKVSQTSLHKDRMVFCVGPDEYIFIGSTSERKSFDLKFKKLAGNFIFSATDISHRNSGFRISGKQATQLINVGCPLDLSLKNFPVGKCTRSIFESAEIMIFRAKEDEFYLETWRSFAPYIARYFEKFCQENG